MEPRTSRWRSGRTRSSQPKAGSSLAASSPSFVLEACRAPRSSSAGEGAGYAGGILSAVSDAEDRLDNANRGMAVADLRKQAAAPTPMRLAREAARTAIERSFAMPLNAAGIGDAKVVARFADEPAGEPSYIDRSVTYNEAMEEARNRRAAEGRQ